jgi:hypothetical protein
MMAVEVKTSETFEAGVPSPLFDAKVSINPRGDHYAVTGNGQRFLFKKAIAHDDRDPWTVVVNWPALLKK